MSENKALGSVRITSLEVVKPTKEQRGRWQMLSDQTRDMTNYIWQTWLCWHVEAGTRDKIVAFLRALDDWKAGGKRGDKPNIKLQAVPKELASRIYHGLSKTFPAVHSRSRGLLQQRVVSLIGSRKAARGSLSGWWAILLYHESLPSTTRGVPIPFDVRNAKLLPPERDGEHHRMELRIESAAGKSVYDTVQVWSKGRKAAGAVAILKKILAGDAKFCGSNLVQRNDGQWYVNVCWRGKPERKPELEANRVAALRPCLRVPWKLRIGATHERRGTNRRPGGLGRVVDHVRRQLLTSRWSRQEAYRTASSARKGQGRQRAIVPTTILTLRWRDFVKTYNHQVTSDVVAQCVANGVGRLVYFQPAGNAGRRFLSLAGKIEGRHDSTGWDWFQVAALLAYKCERAGIVLEVRKSCDVSRSAARCESTGAKAARKR